MPLLTLIALAVTLYLAGLSPETLGYWAALSVGFAHGLAERRAGRVAEREEREIETWTKG